MSLKRKQVREYQQKDVESYDWGEGRIYAEKIEGIFIVKRRKRRGVWVH